MTAVEHDPALLVFIRAASPVVHRLGGAWFFTQDARREGARIGITNQFALYASGRGGVLGDCHPDVVASSFAFFPPDIVKANYLEGLGDRSPHECARAYAAGLAAWGIRVFAGMAGMDRLAVLGRKVAASVQPMGLPLFAGWRAMPQPDRPEAAAALVLQVLRELRGDLHIHAVVAHELTPLEAILGKDGPKRAEELHYPQPYPPLERFLDRREAAESLTDRLLIPAYAVLGPGERDEFLSLLHTADRALATAVTG